MKLKELTSKIGSGATPRGGKNAYLGGKVSLIRSQNVLDNGFSYEGLARISDKQASNLDSVSVFEGDVLLNITGDSIARCCMAPSEILPARVNQHVAIIRPKQEVSTEYLMYWLLFMKPHLLNICRVGGTRNALTKETIEELDIDYPEDAVKRVAVLKVLDDKISNNKRLITELEDTARLIYDYWFTQFDFPDEYGNPYRSSDGKMVWNDELKREIPEGWLVCNFLDVSDWETNSQPPKSEFVYEPTDGYIRFIQNRDYDSLDHITYIPNRKNLFIANRLDILMDKYGDAGKVRYGIEGAFNVALGRIQPKKKELQEYIRSFLASDGVYNYLHNACIASTRASLNESNLSFLNLVIPEEKILLRFQGIILKIRLLILCLIDENESLASLRDWLLPMLMNGQVKVN